MYKLTTTIIELKTYTSKLNLAETRLSNRDGLNQIFSY